MGVGWGGGKNIVGGGEIDESSNMGRGVRQSGGRRRHG